MVAVARLRAAAFALMISGLAGSAAQAQATKAYRDAVKAIEKKDWNGAQQLLRGAIAERSEERKRYTPHYYLGVALFELGDCDAALGEWQESQRQGALGREELARIASGRAACQARRDEQALATADLGAGRALEQADHAAAALRTAMGSGNDELWRQGNPSLSARQSEVESRLEAARAMVATAKTERDASALARGDRAAREIAKELDALRNEAQRLRSEHGERIGGLRTKLDDVVAAARATLKDTADLAPYPQQIKRRRADLESLLRELEGSKQSADHDYLEGLSSRLSFSTQQLKEVAAGPPAALADAADAFFAGDFAEVLARLATIADAPARVRAHSLLLRSAAGYYLWVERGESDQALLAAAAADAVSCQRADAALAPPPTLFSPRFVQFFAAPTATPQPR
jgi:TolA-binding protein